MKFNKETILVVDDISENRELLTRMLTRAHLSSHELDNGQDVFDSLDIIKPDLILLDWMMPGLSGLETLQKIRQLHSAENLPVIMVTALNESARVVEALSNGANDYVTKPIDRRVLMARLQAQLSRKAAAKALAELNHKLEEKVAARTQELIQTNRQLLQEITAQESKQSHLKCTYRAAVKTGWRNGEALWGVSHALHDPLSQIAECIDRIGKSSFDSDCEETCNDIDAMTQAIRDIHKSLDMALLMAQGCQDTKQSNEIVHFAPFLDDLIASNSSGLELDYPAGIDTVFYADSEALKAAIFLILEHWKMVRPDVESIIINCQSEDDFCHLGLVGGTDTPNFTPEWDGEPVFHHEGLGTAMVAARLTVEAFGADLVWLNQGQQFGVRISFKAEQNWPPDHMALQIEEIKDEEKDMAVLDAEEPC